MKTKFTGFSLNELLVVIGILVLLIGISLPAVLAVREGARMTSCQNNIRQIGLGVALFESSHGSIPTAATGGPTPDNQHSYGMPVPILPFLELQQSLDLLQYQPAEFGNDGTPIDSFRDYEILDSVREPIFLCPTDDPRRGRVSYLYSKGTAWLLGENNGFFS